jgi:hypothetical protein
MMVVSVPVAEFCDRCGHQAYWRYESAVTDASPLCFCGHHSHVLMPALKNAGFVPSMLVVRGAAREVVESVG